MSPIPVSAGPGGRHFTDRLPEPHRPIMRWWRVNGSGSVDHAAVIDRVCSESGGSPRLAVMRIARSVTTMAHVYGFGHRFFEPAELVSRRDLVTAKASRSNEAMSLQHGITP